MPRRCRMTLPSLSPTGVRRLGLPLCPAFSVLFCPLSPQPPSPVGKGEIQGYFMQGASPLASPRLSRRRHGLNLRCRCPLWGLPGWSPADLAVLESVGVACPLCRRLTLPLAYFCAPYPPSPLPRRGRGCPKVYFAGGFAPGTPALDRSRHLQLLLCGHPAQGSQQFAATPTEALSSAQCRQPRRGGTGGEELRRLRWSSPPGQVEPVPPGRALCEHEAGGWGQESKLKAGLVGGCPLRPPAGYHSGRSSRQRRKQAPRWARGLPPCSSAARVQPPGMQGAKPLA